MIATAARTFTRCGRNRRGRPVDSDRAMARVDSPISLAKYPRRDFRKWHGVRAIFRGRFCQRLLWTRDAIMTEFVEEITEKRILVKVPSVLAAWIPWGEVTQIAKIQDFDQVSYRLVVSNPSDPALPDTRDWVFWRVPPTQDVSPQNPAPEEIDNEISRTLVKGPRLVFWGHLLCLFLVQILCAVRRVKGMLRFLIFVVLIKAASGSIEDNQNVQERTLACDLSASLTFQVMCVLACLGAMVQCRGGRARHRDSTSGSADRPNGFYKPIGDRSEILTCSPISMQDETTFSSRASLNSHTRVDFPRDIGPSCLLPGGLGSFRSRIFVVNYTPFLMSLECRCEIVTRNDGDHSRSRRRPKQTVTSGRMIVSGLTSVSLDGDRAPRALNNAGVARRFWDQDVIPKIMTRSLLGRARFSCSLSNWPFVRRNGILASRIVFAGGTPTWHSPRLALLPANATVGQRMTFLQETQGWLASDELSHVVSRMRQRHSAYTILPTAFYHPLTDDFCFEQDHAQIPNAGVSLIPVLFGTHWVGIEVDRQHESPDVCILQAPMHMQQQLVFMVCRMLQIPAHRLNVSFGLDTTPPDMCGWGLVWRWLRLTHAENSFHDVLQRLQSLADVNRRIIQRALQKSVTAWAMTRADPELQQVAYTLRLSFLVHLFQFDVNIHSRMDSLAILAAGQPSSVFHTGDADVGSAPSQEHDIAQTPGDPVDTPVSVPPVQHISSQSVGTQTDDIAVAPAESQLCVPCRSTDAVNNRLHVMRCQPDWASSDELDFAARLYQPFLHNVVILPCLAWDRDRFELLSISNLPAFYGSADSVVMMIEAMSHWFLARVDKLPDHFRVRIFGCPIVDIHESNALLHNIANVLQFPLSYAQVHFFHHESPAGMCGYAILWSFLTSENFTWVPFPELAISALQVCQYHQIITLIGNEAVTSWHQVTQDRPLLLFAFAVRALFLHDMVCKGTCGPFRSAGMCPFRASVTIHPSERPQGPRNTSEVTLSTLSRRFDRFYGIRVGEALHPGPVPTPVDPLQGLIKRLREFRPVRHICPRNAHCFAAQVQFDEIVATEDAHLTVRATIQPAGNAFPLAFRDRPVHYPPRNHIKWQVGRIRLFRASWESGPAPTHGWLIDAKAQQLQFGFVVDATLESVGLMFRRPGPPNPEGNIAICELFCGGFAGWAQAAAFLNEHELPARPVFALDRDFDSAEIYAINHAPSRRVCRRPQEAVQSLQDNTLSPTEPIVCQCDVREGWWMQFTPVVDIVTMSPPCPAWSSAHVAYGLTRPDGFDTVEGLFKARLLYPRAIAFENVKNMRSHAHFPVLEEVIRWLGLRVKWASVVNLAEVLPQARERLLMTLIPADGDVKPTFQFTSWRARDHLSLQTSDILRKAGCLSHTISPPLDAEILRMYLHPKYVPGDRCGDFKTAKTYRLKNEQNTCACVLAHYGFAHELGEEVRSKNGLLEAFLS